LDARPTFQLTYYRLPAGGTVLAEIRLCRVLTLVHGGEFRYAGGLQVNR